MKYDDLLLVPFRTHGRDTNGMDCYGLVLELAKRNGQDLTDIFYISHEINGAELQNLIEKTNVMQIEPDDRRAGDVAEWEYKNNLHVGYFLDPERVINMTFSGVKITPYFVINNPKILRIKKEHGTN